MEILKALFDYLGFPALLGTFFLSQIFSDQCNLPKETASLITLIFGIVILSSLLIIPKTNKRWRRAIASLSIISIIFSITAWLWRHVETPSHNEFKILVAPFRAGNDSFNLVNNFRKGIDDLKDNRFSFVELNNPISGGSGLGNTKICLTDCLGTAIVWGSYSESLNDGTALVYVDFSNGCMYKWSGDFFQEREIPVTGPFQINVRDHAKVLAKYIASFNTVISDPNSCKFKSMPTETETHLKSLVASSKGIGDLKRMRINAFTFLANDAFNKKNYIHSISILEEAEKDFPEDLDLKFFLAFSEFQNKNPNKALYWLESGLKMNPLDAGYLNAKGNVLRVLGDFNGAVSAYTAAIDLLKNDPSREKDRAAYLANMGGLYAQVGQLSTAYEKYNQSLQVAPAPKVQESRLDIAIRVEDFKTAESDIASLRKIKSDELKYLDYSEGNYYFAIGNSKKAIKLYDKALKNVDPKNSDPSYMMILYLNAASAKFQANKDLESKKDILNGLKISPTDPRLNFMRCKIENRLGEYKNALKACHVAQRGGLNSVELTILINELMRRSNGY